MEIWVERRVSKNEAWKHKKTEFLTLNFRFSSLLHSDSCTRMMRAANATKRSRKFILLLCIPAYYGRVKFSRTNKSYKVLVSQFNCLETSIAGFPAQIFVGSVNG